jgi:hypothetical protein
MARRPNPPGLEEKLDFIFSEMLDVCDAPITVWIECMFVPFEQLVLEWYAIDLKQIIITFFRPKLPYQGLRWGRHGSRGRKGKRKLRRNPLTGILEFDPNEFLGKLLQGGEEFAERPVGPWAARFWIIEGVIERITFWWFVLEIVSDFLYRWMSAVAETAYCRARDNPVFLGMNSGTISIGILGWAPSGWGAPVKMRRILFYNGYGVMQAVGNGIASFSGACRGTLEGVSGSISARVRIINGPGLGREAVHTVYTTDLNEAAFALTIDIGPADTVIVETLADHQIYEWFEDQFLVQAVP